MGNQSTREVKKDAKIKQLTKPDPGFQLRPSIPTVQALDTIWLSLIPLWHPQMHFSSYCYTLHITLWPQEMSCTHVPFPVMPHCPPLHYLELPLAFALPCPLFVLDWWCCPFPRAAAFAMDFSKLQLLLLSLIHVHFPPLQACVMQVMMWCPLALLIPKAGPV